MRSYDVADGLANSVVSSIYQDKKGFLWISTQEGLSRFDGYAFANYGVRDGLGHQIVNDVAEDKQGRLWVATNGGGVSLLIERQTGTPKGLNVKANEKFISFPVSPKQGADYVNRIHFDSQNNLWCLTDFGLYRASLRDLANLKFEPVAEKQSGNSYSLIEDHRGRLWCGLGNELFEIKDGQVINHGSSGEGADIVGGASGERGDFIMGIVETKDGRLLVATPVALYEFKPKDNADTADGSVQRFVIHSRRRRQARPVRFAAGETSKTVSVFVVDDSYLEGAETFTVNLTNPSGASLGTPSTATVTITDNDLANGSNPIDTTGFFVRLHYLDFLNREPDTDGFNFWTGQIDNCTTKPQCTEVTRINVSASFFLSIEFQQTGFLVERMYKAAYGDANGTSTLGGMHTLKVPIILLNEFLLDTQQIGEGVIVLQPGWETVLENNKQAFALEFVQRTRFTNAFSTTLTPTQFVDMLFANAGVTPSAADRTAAIDEFGGAPNTTDNAVRARALRRVAENTLFTQAEFNRAFVLMQYFGYLRRNPNDFQDSDHTGYEFWLNKLNQFSGNYINAEMVKAFITSIEYRQRFGP